MFFWYMRLILIASRSMIPFRSSSSINHQINTFAFLSDLSLTLKIFPAIPSSFFHKLAILSNYYYFSEPPSFFYFLSNTHTVSFMLCTSLLLFDLLLHPTTPSSFSFVIGIFKHHFADSRHCD